MIKVSTKLFSALACAAAMMSGVVVSVGAEASVRPRQKPVDRDLSRLVSNEDFQRLEVGLDAAKDKNWATVRAARARAQDPTVALILDWYLARNDVTLSFAETVRLAEQLEGWPNANDIWREAESKITGAGLTPQEIADFFAAHPAQSGEGLIAQADALIALGRADEGEEKLREAWRGRTLALSLQKDTLAAHGSRLTAEDHSARVDYLLWLDWRQSASALLSRLPSDQRALAVARMRLSARAAGVQAAVNAVPASLTAHPGLLFERARWRRKARNWDDARPLMLQVPADAAPDDARRRVWLERRRHMLRAMSDELYADAYMMASANGLSAGADFAEAEWLAGWIALRRLNDPVSAERHFATLEANVTTPISRSRALYWLAEAARAQNDAERATSYFERAAVFHTAYYGQLAAAELGPRARETRLPRDPVISETDRLAFETVPMARAAILFKELDETGLFRRFAYALDDRLETPAQVALLAELARDANQFGVATRGGKSGLQQGFIVPSAAYPLIELPEVADLGEWAPEPALVLALMRQESEFHTDARSHAGALGLMQLMPATAAATARQLGVDYRRNWLTDDPEYNMTLGIAHLAELLEEFNGSYVVAIASYNAGASRGRRWIAEHGDPSDDSIDPVEWVEKIPFSETRNYVQRVLENLQVYRARLNEGETILLTDADLVRGSRQDASGGCVMFAGARSNDARVIQTALAAGVSLSSADACAPAEAAAAPSSSSAQPG